MMITLNSTKHEAIERFVADHPAACLGHLPRWLSILQDGLGHTPMALSAWSDGQVVGWLPMVLTRSLLFGTQLTSLPYVDQSGLIAHGAEIQGEMIRQAANLARQHRARFAELRNTAPIDHPELSPARPDKLLLHRPLPPDEESLWKSLDSKVRNQIRKSEKNNFAIRFGGQELLDAFYRLFCIRMRDLGTPVYPRSLFAALLHHLGPGAEIALLTDGPRPVAGAILIHHNQITEIPSAACLTDQMPRCANMGLYWHLTRRAIQKNSTIFDFGRSTADSGPHRFKLQWGAIQRPVAWRLWRTGGAEGAAAPIIREDDRFNLAIRCWRKMPVWMTRLAGPAIARRIPA